MTLAQQVAFQHVRHCPARLSTLSWESCGSCTTFGFDDFAVAGSCIDLAGALGCRQVNSAAAWGLVYLGIRISENVVIRSEFLVLTSALQLPAFEFSSVAVCRLAAVFKQACSSLISFFRWRCCFVDQGHEATYVVRVQGYNYVIIVTIVNEQVNIK